MMWHWEQPSLKQIIIGVSGSKQRGVVGDSGCLAPIPTRNVVEMLVSGNKIFSTFWSCYKLEMGTEVGFVLLACLLERQCCAPDKEVVGAIHESGL
jgi:hypothetical protein